VRPAYDLVVIGGGAAGSEAALSVADGGRTSILLVEANHFGGTCTNHGCVPTKALGKASRAAQAMRSASEFGLAGGEPRFDWEDVIGRAFRVRDHMLREGVAPFTRAGVDVEFPAQAMLTGERRLEVGGRTIEAGAVVLATGLEPSIPLIPGLAEAGYLDNESALELRELPRRLAVLGGGVAGVYVPFFAGAAPPLAPLLLDLLLPLQAARRMKTRGASARSSSRSVKPTGRSAEAARRHI